MIVFGAIEVLVTLGILALIVLGAVIGWERYRGGDARSAPGMGSQPTTEVFIDPETGRRMRVWYDARTGQRDYRPE